MEPLFISPSKLELYRKFIQRELWDSITFDKLKESIMGVQKWTPKSVFGTAYHTLLEKGPENFLDYSTGRYVVCDGELPHPVTLYEEEIAPILYFRAKYPRMVYEQRYYHKMEVEGVPVVLPMRFDGLNGLEVHEQKTTEGEYDFTGYSRSLQWRVYLWATGAQVAQYNIFEYDQPQYSEFKRVRYVPFKLYPYAGMEGDIMGYLYGFIKFCKTHGLTEYLYRQKKTTA
jgi:hypothetical protein